MDELACFAPGMLALGSSGYESEEAEKILSLAEEVLKVVTLNYYGCYHYFFVVNILSATTALH